MDFLLNEELDLPAVGEIRTGYIVKHSDNVILVDIGAKSEGVIVGSELDAIDKDVRKTLAIGSEVKVFIAGEDANGNPILSYNKAAEEQDWERAAELLASQDVLESKVVGYNRGGLLAKLGALRGFVPGSQLGRNRQFNRQDSPDKRFRHMVGEPIKLKVIEVDRDRNRLILSERAARQEIREAQRDKILAELNEGDVCDGRVVNLADFGAFVDIGGIEGLVHLSELSWKRINKPSEVLQVGDEVQVYVLNVDREKQRLALSLRRLEPDPWSLIEDHYRNGQLVEATITKLTKFGAFARIEDEYELVGLIHISELSEDHVAHPREVVKPSEKVMVRIIRIDPEQRQLGLSLKEVSSDKYLEVDMETLSTL